MVMVMDWIILVNSFHSWAMGHGFIHCDYISCAISYWHVNIENKQANDDNHEERGGGCQTCYSYMFDEYLKWHVM